MPYTYEHDQVSATREVKEITPAVSLERREQSIENGQVVSADTTRVGQVARDEVIVNSSVEKEPPSFDERMESALERKWLEMGERLADSMKEGQVVKVEIAGHELTATRGAVGVTFEVDKEPQNSAHGLDFLDKTNTFAMSAITSQLIRDNEERRKEEERRRRLDKADRDKVAAKEYREKMDKDQRSYDAQLKGDRYVVAQIQQGADIER